MGSWRGCRSGIGSCRGAAGQDADDDLDLDPAFAACVQHSLRGPHFAGASDPEPPPHTVSAYGLHLHAATTVDARDRR